MKKNPKVLEDFSQYLARKGREKGSCIFMEEYLEKTRKPGTYWIHLAKRWRKLGMLLKASRAEAIAHRAWALKYLERGNYELASLHAKLYMKFSLPGDRGPYIAMALVAIYKGEEKLAEKLAEKIPDPEMPLKREEIEPFEPWIRELKKVRAWKGLLVPPKKQFKK